MCGSVARLSCATYSWWMAGMRYALGDYTGVATMRQPLRMLDLKTTADNYKKEAEVMGIIEE